MHPPLRLPRGAGPAPDGPRRERPRRVQPHRVRRPHLAARRRRGGRSSPSSSAPSSVCLRVLQPPARQRADAMYGRAAVVPVAAAGDPHRHRARARPGQQRPRDLDRVRARSTPASCAARCCRCGSRTSSPPTAPSASTNARILLHRVFPNTLTPLVVQATLGFATAVLEIAGLGFLGLGVQPPDAEWGTMISLGLPQHPQRAAPRALPRHLDLPQRAGVQPPRRRAPRRPRPPQRAPRR